MAKPTLYYVSKPVWFSSSSPECSVGTGFPGTRYSSLTHLPRSSSLQRSEQNGRKGLSCHSTCLLQVGQCFIEVDGEKLAGYGDFGNRVQQSFGTLHENPSINKFDRTFTTHRVQANGDALASGAYDGGDFSVR